MVTPPGGITPPTAPKMDPTGSGLDLSPEDLAKIDELLKELQKNDPNIDKDTVTKIYKELKKDNPNLKDMKVEDIEKLISEKSEKIISDTAMKKAIEAITKAFPSKPSTLPDASPDEVV